jgi:hypothetical protein
MVFITLLDGDVGLVVVVVVICEDVLLVVSTWETCFIDAAISRFDRKKFGNGRSRKAKCGVRLGGYKNKRNYISYLLNQ